MPTHKSSAQDPEDATACSCLDRGLKTTTGIVGLEVDAHARETVQTKAEAVLDAVKVIGADVQYRKNVEATFQFWLKQVSQALLR